jgi:uncharacterized protein
MGKGSGNCSDRPALSIFGVSDLHLGPGTGKGHYSSSWVDHQSKLRKAWDTAIHADDLVLLPGDISWHRDPEDMRYDYLWIDERPGATKVISPGNHDYGVWTSEADANAFLEQFETQTAVMDNAIRLENPIDPEGPGLVIAAAQGSQTPNDKYFNTNAGASAKGKANESVRFLGELIALDQALKHAQKLRADGDNLIVMVHYPPFANGTESTVFSDMIERAGADLCVYGHLHQKEQFRKTVQTARDGVTYRFVGSDFLKFTPTKLAEWSAEGLQVGELEVDGKKAWPESKKSWSGGYGSSSSSSKSSSVQVDRNGKKLVCASCKNEILEREHWHYTAEGPVHHSEGEKASYNMKNTCPFASGASSKSGSSTGSKGGSSASATGSPPPPTQKATKEPMRMTWAPAATHANCEDCGRPFNAGEVYHTTDTGYVHGKGLHNQRNVCYHRPKNVPSHVMSGAATKRCEGCDTPIGAAPLAQWSRVKTGKNKGKALCLSCQKPQA